MEIFAEVFRGTFWHYMYKKATPILIMCPVLARVDNGSVCMVRRSFHLLLSLQ